MKSTMWLFGQDFPLVELEDGDRAILVSDIDRAFYADYDATLASGDLAVLRKFARRWVGLGQRAKGARRMILNRWQAEVRLPPLERDDPEE